MAMVEGGEMPSRMSQVVPHPWEVQASCWRRHLRPQLPLPRHFLVTNYQPCASEKAPPSVQNFLARKIHQEYAVSVGWMHSTDSYTLLHWHFEPFNGFYPCPSLWDNRNYTQDKEYYNETILQESALQEYCTIVHFNRKFIQGQQGRKVVFMIPQYFVFEQIPCSSPIFPLRLTLRLSVALCNIKQHLQVKSLGKLERQTGYRGCPYFHHIVNFSSQF